MSPHPPENKANCLLDPRSRSNSHATLIFEREHSTDTPSLNPQSSTALAVAQAQKTYGRFPAYRSPGMAASWRVESLATKEESVIEHSAYSGDTTRRTRHVWCAPAGAGVKTVSGNSRCCISRLSQKGRSPASLAQRHATRCNTISDFATILHRPPANPASGPGTCPPTPPDGPCTRRCR